MGKSGSKHEHVHSRPPPKPLPSPQPPPPPPEFDRPWRKMRWEDKGKIKHGLRNFQLNHAGVRFVRILLVGDVGAGKSSFINSVNNAFQGRITSEALTNTTGGTSFTKLYETYHIKGKDGSPLPFVFNDVMGFEKGENGAQTRDIVAALKGLLREGFDFEASSFEYRRNPSAEDQSYCLVYVVAANTVSMMEPGVVHKMKRIRETATKLKMPQVVIMTKPDLTCKLVHHDLRKIYTSKKIKEKMHECSYLLGVTMNHIFPVKNYHEEFDTDDDMDALILKALDQIVNIACDALQRRSLDWGVDPE